MSQPLYRNMHIVESFFQDSKWLPENIALAKTYIARIKEGDGTADRTASPVTFSTEGGEAIPVLQLLRLYFDQTMGEQFSSKDASLFCEQLQEKAGWDAITDALFQWTRTYLREAYFIRVYKDEMIEEWQPNAAIPREALSEERLAFSCYIATANRKYSDLETRLRTMQIFAWLTALDPEIVSRLRKEGTGKLPEDIYQQKTVQASCVANDAFAVIRITLKEETQLAYQQALNFLCRLLEYGFPKNYSVEFRSYEKHYLPVKGFPQKGIHQLFANAVMYPNLYPLMEKYAHLAMKRGAYYLDLDQKHRAIPGAFAVFALTLAEVPYFPLLKEYMQLCGEGEVALLEKFMVTLIAHHGFYEQSIDLFLQALCVCPAFRYHGVLAEQMENRIALEAFLNAKSQLASYHKDTFADQTEETEWCNAFWKRACHTVWGAAAMKNNGAALQRKAPEHLRPLYQQIFEER